LQKKYFKDLKNNSRKLSCRNAASSDQLREQGCQMVYFQTQNPNLGKFWRAFKRKRLVYSMADWNISRPFGNLAAIWYIHPHYGTLCQERSGNPVRESESEQKFV
jgi:hypothetical protein